MQWNGFFGYHGGRVDITKIDSEIFGDLLDDEFDVGYFFEVVDGVFDLGRGVFW